MTKSDLCYFCYPVEEVILLFFFFKSVIKACNVIRKMASPHVTYVISSYLSKEPTVTYILLLEGI